MLFVSLFRLGGLFLGDFPKKGAAFAKIAVEEWKFTLF